MHHQSDQWSASGSDVLEYLHVCVCFPSRYALEKNTREQKDPNISFTDGNKPEGWWRESAFRQTHISELTTAAEELLNAVCRIVHLSIWTCTQTKHKNV